jgi:hypothetical protein
MGRWAALGAAALLAVACASPTIVPTAVPTATPAVASPVSSEPLPPSPMDHPTGATDVVLRLENVPSMAPYPGDTLQEGTLFTLYGDGHLIYSEQPSAEGPAELRHVQLSNDELDAVLAETLAALGPARGVYDDV